MFCCYGFSRDNICFDPVEPTVTQAPSSSQAAESVAVLDQQDSGLVQQAADLLRSRPQAGNSCLMKVLNVFELQELIRKELCIKDNQMLSVVSTRLTYDGQRSTVLQNKIKALCEEEADPSGEFSQDIVNVLKQEIERSVPFIEKGMLSIQLNQKNKNINVIIPKKYKYLFRAMCDLNPLFRLDERYVFALRIHKTSSGETNAVALRTALEVFEQVREKNPNDFLKSAYRNFSNSLSIRLTRRMSEELRGNLKGIQEHVNNSLKECEHLSDPNTNNVLSWEKMSKLQKLFEKLGRLTMRYHEFFR